MDFSAQRRSKRNENPSDKFQESSTFIDGSACCGTQNKKRRFKAYFGSSNLYVFMKLLAARCQWPTKQEVLCCAMTPCEEQTCIDRIGGNIGRVLVIRLSGPCSVLCVCIDTCKWYGAMLICNDDIHC